MSQNVRDLIAEIPESEWQPAVDEDGSLSETGLPARTLHAMDRTPKAFCLAVQKTRVPGKVKPQDPAPRHSLSRWRSGCRNSS